MFPHTLSTKRSATGGPQGLLLLFFCPSSSVLHSLCYLPFPTMPFPSPLTFPSFTSLSSSPLLAGRHPGKGPSAGINQQRPMGFTGAKQIETSGGLFPLPALSSHGSLHSTNDKILTSLFTWPWPAVPGGLTGHCFTPTLHMVLQRHNDFFEFWLPLDKFDLVHLFGRGRQAKDEYSCSSHSVKLISVGTLQYGSLPKGSEGSL